VQDGAVFGLVDPVAGEHPADGVLQPAGLGQLQQQAERFGGDAVLGVIHEDVVEAHGELAEAFRVLREKALHVDAFYGRAVGNQLFPGVGGGGSIFGSIVVL